MFYSINMRIDCKVLCRENPQNPHYYWGFCKFISDRSYTEKTQNPSRLCVFLFLVFVFY